MRNWISNCSSRTSLLLQFLAIKKFCFHHEKYLIKDNIVQQSSVQYSFSCTRFSMNMARMRTRASGDSTALFTSWLLSTVLYQQPNNIDWPHPHHHLIIIYLQIHNWDQDSVDSDGVVNPSHQQAAGCVQHGGRGCHSTASDRDCWFSELRQELSDWEPGWSEYSASRNRDRDQETSDSPADLHSQGWQVR